MYAHGWDTPAAFDDTQWAEVAGICHTLLIDHLETTNYAHASAHDLINLQTKISESNLFQVNGGERHACDTFVLCKDPYQMTWVCETDELPYDTLVTALLCVLHTRFPTHIKNVTTLGTDQRWQVGLHNARRHFPKAKWPF